MNGFNSMFRHVMLERLYALPELSAVWRIADFCYGAPSALHLFGREGLVASFSSQRGSRQGCVLGTLLFCLGLQPVLEEASHGLEALTVSAYIDDIAAVGPQSRHPPSLIGLKPFALLLVSLSRFPSPRSYGHPMPLLRRLFVPGLLSIPSRFSVALRLCLAQWWVLTRILASSLPLSAWRRWRGYSRPWYILCLLLRQVSFSFASALSRSSTLFVARCLLG